MIFRGIVLLIMATVFSAPVLVAQTSRPAGSEVLIVYRPDFKESKQVALYYAERRSIPTENLCPVSGLHDATDSIPFDDFDKKVKKKVLACLEKADKSRILYILLTYGFPFKLSGVPTGYGEALDQYLAEPFDQSHGARYENPYAAQNDPRNNSYPPFQSLAEFRSAHPNIFLYSVWRLDGASAKVARSLVDKAIATEKKGTRGIACFDRKYGNIQQVQPTGLGLNDWRLLRAAEFARKAGLDVIEDDHVEEFGTPPAPQRCANAILYAGWYSLNHYNDAFDWAEGAIGLHQDSLSCLNPRAGKSWCAKALEKGITITSGAVSEPFLEGLPKPDGVVADLLRGANVGDALLRNTAWLNWQVINIGDPLYRPFPGRGAIPGKRQ
jgi:uncharacterized protein (TIGR03790 family)